MSKQVKPLETDCFGRQFDRPEKTLLQLVMGLRRRAVMSVYGCAWFSRKYEQQRVGKAGCFELPIFFLMGPTKSKRCYGDGTTPSLGMR